ncbi:MSHA biogenesis protein MshN [Aliivibrio salmonicida]|uniref:Type IV pilus, mannose-sensitive hemagglutinin D (MSHN) n=1 Tax=Aliivibrio salmonicida (strain LFI1238) TaxID=316275 RepID=B6EM75_ALISL|nr:type IV pilus, mannose-sensitive hemagglutinin D (MSHN) [Aliivibrio salmonicida]AZL83905.1 MSHA biogenesis protein MshN [Aliivibrio salmonicida]CAQ78156.1 type IV pilus, mannose-sensitive hemagglutinin D (MSHN) [Aliivibrio salmonicida LFI1238]
MSVTNKALLNITKAKSDVENTSTISPAIVPNMESRFKAPFFFAIGLLSSISVLGWATLNNEPTPVTTPIANDAAVVELASNSPTKNSTPESVSSIYLSESRDKTEKQAAKITTPVPTAIIKTASTAEKPTVKNENTVPVISTKQNVKSESDAFYVEEVELLPSELAEKSRSAARKALDESDFKQAILEYYTVLKYQPRDDDSRKKLAALLYGKHQVKEAAVVLQQGIKLDNDSVTLRLALASLLQREEQPEAALSVVEYIPLEASIDYLATRGGLAQQLKFIDLAKESYQMLVNKDPDNGRWWLGLAIVYEREAEIDKAYDTYQSALIKPGLSRSSQVFVRDRIKLLETMKEVNNAS